MPVDWEQARAQALHPGLGFALAKLIVETIRHADHQGHTMTTTDLPESVGAIGEDDGIFRTALHIAERDGYLERTVGRRWRPTDFAAGAPWRSSSLRGSRRSG